MNKIILHVFTTILVMSSHSFCMLLNPKRFLPTKRFFCINLSPKERTKLYRSIKKNKEIIRLLKQDSTINMQRVWELDSQNRRNIRILNTYNKLETEDNPEN